MMDQNTFYVAARVSDGMFVAIDSYTGGRPYFTDHLPQAEVFRGDSYAINQLICISSEGELVVYELTTKNGRTLGEFEHLVREDIKNQALAKLTIAERRALGY